ncbi:MAG: hypothetical protein GXY44_03135, partial [Phycisphaerales bacterium]|nr:hypothetical protein [Phycisphaerales bacterium]
MLVLVPGLILVALGLIAEILVTTRPVTEYYSICERVGWPAATETFETVE